MTQTSPLSRTSLPFFSDILKYSFSASIILRSSSSSPAMASSRAAMLTLARWILL
jgi:hypothetical protein